jgi:hypothetical protein
MTRNRSTCGRSALFLLTAPTAAPTLQKIRQKNVGRVNYTSVKYLIAFCISTFGIFRLMDASAVHISEEGCRCVIKPVSPGCAQRS